MKALQRKIMRGIYYAYILRLSALPGVWQAFVMLGIIVALRRFVSIADVLLNITEVEVGMVIPYLLSAARSTEIWTLVLLGLFVWCLYSLKTSIYTSRYTFARS
jgi:hypothetical protein